MIANDFGDGRFRPRRDCKCDQFLIIANDFGDGRFRPIRDFKCDHFL